MPLLPNVLSQSLIQYFQTNEQTNLQAAQVFAYAYVTYANQMTFITPGSLNSLTRIISQLIAAVPPSPIPGTWAEAVDASLVAFWPAASGLLLPPGGVITPTAPGTGAALILASLTPAGLAGAPINTLATVLATALDTYTRTFMIAFADGSSSPLT